MREELLEHKALVYVSATGAGLAFQSNLWGTPGSSEYIVGFQTPYRRGQTIELLGYDPDDSFVSPIVAIDLAMASYIQASKHKVLSGEDGNPVGVGITASVASNRMPRGDQRSFTCVITKDRVLVHYHLFEKGMGESLRKAHDYTIAAEAEDVLIAGITGRGCAQYYPEVNIEKALDRFYQFPTFLSNGKRSKEMLGTGLYLPASLNPIHDGHREMARVGEHLCLRPTNYLISTSSPHKGDLTLQEMLFKAGMLRAESELRSFEFTKSEPLFLDKARARPGSTFIIGTDTMERFLDPKWGPSIPEMLKEFEKLNTKFLVMGRVMNGDFKTADAIQVDENYRYMFSSIEGRVDISSTELRAR